MRTFFDHLRRDVRDARRSLARRPGFTGVAVLSLAIGIGANTAIFTLVHAILFRTTPVDRPERLVNVYLHQTGFPYSTLSYPELQDLRDAAGDVFSHIGASQIVPAQVDGEDGVGTLLAEVVSGNYFQMLGINAALGRTLLPGDDVDRGGHPVVMLGHGYWQSAFSGSPDVVGRQMRISGRSYTIVGVAPADYAGSLKGLTPAFYAPSVMVEVLTGAPTLDERRNHSLFVKARLRDGAGLPQAVAAVGRVAASLTRDKIAGWDPQAQFTLMPVDDVLLYPPLDRYVRASAWLLSVVVGLVLLLACTNLASFLLARAIDRHRDVAVRLALGASRRVLIGGLLVETTILSLLAGALGFGLSIWLLRVLVRTDLPLPIPITVDLSPDWVVLAFTLAVSAVAGAALGVVPAWQSTRPDLVSALKSDTAGGGRAGHVRWRNALVIAQVTVSLVLLVGAGLFLRSFQRVLAVDPGFGREPAALLSFIVPATRFTTEEARVHTQRLLDRFRQVPGVEAIGLTDNLPLNPLSTQSIGFLVDGHDPPPGRPSFAADRVDVDGGYFDAIGIPILRGRTFSDADRDEVQSVAIISDAMARRFWPGGDAVGRLIRTPDPQDDDLVVVGVAADAKIRSLGEPPRDMVYRSYLQHDTRGMTVVAKTSGDAAQTARALMAAGREIDPDFWVWEMKTLERHLAVVRLPAELSALILTAFAALALLLACIGLYGVVNYAVAQRTREMGIRVALGADPGKIVRLLAFDGLRLVVIGGVLGMAAAIGLMQLLSGLLFGGRAFDALTLIGVPAVLGASAALAAYLPARRAGRVDPLLALRAE
jgi:putative ABC transport system permease protein